ncbi:MAG: hypothetical protein IT381_08490 [Deltaproteobacteria bacterium]|nr:hypothetical protein [Deltaproteobacteria bacterium]
MSTTVTKSPQSNVPAPAPSQEPAAKNDAASAKDGGQKAQSTLTQGAGERAGKGAISDPNSAQWQAELGTSGLSAGELGARPKIAGAAAEAPRTAADREAELKGFLELANQVGADRPAGTPAGFLSARLQDLETAPASIHDLVKLLDPSEQQALAKRTDDREDAQGDRIALLHTALAKLEAGVLEKSLSGLTAQKREAFDRMCAVLSPQFTEQVVRPSLSYKLPLRPQKTEKKSQRSVSDSDVKVELMTAMRSLPPISLPPPAVVIVEQSFTKELSSLPGIDVDALTQMVLMSCAKDGERDLRDLLKEMQKTNKQRKQLRGFIANQKKNKANMQETLRSEYDRRAGLAKKDKARIDPEITSFDDFSKSQKVVQSGDLLLDEEGIPHGTLAFTISPNTTYFRQKEEKFFTVKGAEIAQTTVDLADRLGLTPAKAQTLVDYWNANLSTLKAIGGPKPGRFETMEQWLLAPTTCNGVNLKYPPALETTQDDSVDGYLTTRDPEYITKNLQETFGLSERAAGMLIGLWEEHPPAFRGLYDHQIGNWIDELPPFGPGFKPSATPQPDSVVDDFVTTYRAEQKVGATAEAFGLSRGEALAAHQYFAVDPRGAVDFEAFLKDKIGLEKDPAKGAQNGDRVESALTNWTYFVNSKQYQDAQKAFENDEAIWGPYNTYLADKKKWDEQDPKITEAMQRMAGRSADVANDIVNRLGALGGLKAAEDYAGPRNQLQAEIDAYGAILPPDPTHPGRGIIDSLLLHYIDQGIKVAWLDAQGTDDKVDGAELWLHNTGLLETARKNLDDEINRLPEPDKSIAKNYVAMQLKMAASDEKRMNTVDRISYGKINYHNRFIEPSMGYARGVAGSEYNHIEIPLTDKARKQLEAIPFGTQAFYNACWMDKKHHASASDFFNGKAGGIIAVELPPEWAGAMASAPKEVPKPQFTPPAISEETDRFLNAAKAQLGVLKDPRNNIKPRNQTGSSLTGVPTDDLFVANVSELKKPVDHRIVQPPHVDVAGSEMTLAQLEADIEKWQSQYDSLGDLSEEQAIKMQMYQERRAKFFETLSNVMKKTADTSKAILGNLK